MRGISFAVEQGRAVRAARPERRRQDDDDQDADHASAADERRGARARPRRRRRRTRGAEADRLRVRRRPRAVRATLGASTTSATSPSSTASRGKAQRLRIDEVLELVGLKGREQERVEGYSRGMRQRLHIARGILHDPEVVFLDEPTIGVDPVGARELRQTIADLSQAGKTVLLTTHYMFEADTLCDRIAVIAKGRIVGEGTPRGAEGRRRRRTRHRDRGVRRRRGDRRAVARDRRASPPSRSRSASRSSCSSSRRRAAAN